MARHVSLAVVPQSCTPCMAAAAAAGLAWDLSIAGPAMTRHLAATASWVAYACMLLHAVVDCTATAGLQRLTGSSVEAARRPLPSSAAFRSLHEGPAAAGAPRHCSSAACSPSRAAGGRCNCTPLLCKLPRQGQGAAHAQLAGGESAHRICPAAAGACCSWWLPPTCYQIWAV